MIRCRVSVIRCRVRADRRSGAMSGKLRGKNVVISQHTLSDVEHKVTDTQIGEYRHFRVHDWLQRYKACFTLYLL